MRQSFEQNLVCTFRSNDAALGAYMLKAIANFKIHQNLLKYWFTLLNFVMDDPVLGNANLQKICRAQHCFSST